jgi:NADH-quinone oxidoreductase subunit C
MSAPVRELLEAAFPGVVERAEEFRGDVTLTVRRENLVRVCQMLKTDPALSFTMVIDILGVDMYRPGDRFRVIYNLYSLERREYLRLNVPVDAQDTAVPTVTGVWPGANWHERETYDMFGIVFTGHPDLRRLYMPEEFEYFPLRKDFPTMGIPDSLPLPRR